MATPAKTNTEALFIPDDTKKIETNRVNEKILIEELSTVIQTRDIHDGVNDSFILGHPTNGVLGTTNGVGGNQVVLGDFRGDFVLQRVVNPNDIFREHFRNTDFKDASAANTADWDTTLFRVKMSSSSNHATVYNTTATSSPIAYAQGTLSVATLSAVETKWNANDQILYYLSADGGSNWESVTLNTQHTFTNTGTDLRFRIVFIGNGGADTYISYLQVTYT